MGTKSSESLAASQSRPAWEALTAAVVGLRAGWRDGEPPQLADLLPDGPTELRRLVLIELVKVDLVCRWQDAANRKNVRDYVAEFPELDDGDGIPCDLIHEERRIRQQAGEDASLADYQTESEVNALAAIRVSTMQDFAAVSRHRFDAGDISQIELDLAVLAYTQARMQLATAAADFAESRQAVTSLVFNVPETRWPRIGAEFEPPSTGSVTAEDLVMTLPHVRAAKQQVEAASARVSLRERERRVDPTLTLRGGKEDDETLVGLNVTIPLPIRNSFRHEVIAASAEHRQAQQVFSDVARRAYTRFLGAQERYRISQGAWQDWRETGDVSLQSQGTLLKRLWEASELSTTDYLVQLRQTLDTEESALELRRSMWGAWFEWMTASGQIESWLGTGS